MANYSKATDFAAKDALTTGDPDKVIVGTEIDDEFNAIATAITSKANAASPALTGTGTAVNLTVSGTLTSSGTLAATSITLGGVAITSTAAELNILDGVTSTAAELNILDGVTSTAAELNILDGVTATATEINYLDLTTLGTAENSKAVTVSAGGAINLASKAITNANIDGGAIDGTTIGANSASTGAFTTLTASSTATFGTVDINGGAIDGAPIGANSASTGAFTTLSTTGKLTIGAEYVESTGSMPAGTTPAIDPANGTIQTWTLSGVSSPTDSLAAGESVTLHILDGTAYTITWPTMEWIGGSAPTLDTTNETIVQLWKVGSTLYGALVGVSS